MRIIRSLLISLGISLLVGFAIGTVIRLRMERPKIYIGAQPGRATLPALAPLPLDVFDAGAPVGHARHHEEQIRETIQIA